MKKQILHIQKDQNNPTDPSTKDMDTIKVIGPISEEEKTILIPSLFHMERGTDCAAADAAAADDVALARSRGGRAISLMENASMAFDLAFVVDVRPFHRSHPVWVIYCRRRHCNHWSPS